ncbi:MAG: hypothetical protein B7Y99_01775 [Caulobacterales bacterium 32-69-10]|nr:MAG: hypothetical protein B7Y99_01775 [Caulobacterales bacterium 32-69-10]
MQDRALRSLARLQNSGATSRVLNLNRLHKQYEQLPEHRAQPFFRNPLLNKALIVKHRLRENELDLFADYRSTATKVILPIDGDDLASGGRYAFVGQQGYEAILTSAIGDGPDAQSDRKTLEILSQLPSFDPFLMREHLRRFDIRPAPHYFDISEGDLRRMFDFMQGELSELVGLSMSDSDITTSTALLAEKIFSNTAVEDMEPLRLTLRLDRSEYLEGVFCWKGFLYYKWKLGELNQSAPALIDQLRNIAPIGKGDDDAREYLKGARTRIISAILSTRRVVDDTLKVYDQAYRRLTSAGDAVAFRDFLLQAPSLFISLGEKLGVIDHICSFWAFRFPEGKPHTANALELMDIFLDFEEGLGLKARAPHRGFSPRDAMVLAG